MTVTRSIARGRPRRQRRRPVGRRAGGGRESGRSFQHVCGAGDAAARRGGRDHARLRGGPGVQRLAAGVASERLLHAARHRRRERERVRERDPSASSRSAAAAAAAARRRQFRSCASAGSATGRGRRPAGSPPRTRRRSRAAAGRSGIALVGDGERRRDDRRARVEQARRVDVVEFENVGGGAVDERSDRRGNPVATPDDAAGTGAGPRPSSSAATIGCVEPPERHAEPVDERVARCGTGPPSGPSARTATARAASAAATPVGAVTRPARRR